MFFEKIFRKTELPKEKKEVTIDDLFNIILKSSDEKRKELLNISKPIVKKIGANILDLKNSLKSIKNSKIPKEDKKMFNIVSTSRRNLSNQLLEIIDDINISMGSIDYENLVSYNKLLINFFSRTSNSAKMFYYASLMDRKRIDKLNTLIVNLDSNRKLLEEIINKSGVVPLNNIDIELKKLRMDTDEIKEVEDEKNNISSELERQMNDKTELSVKIKTLESGIEYKQYLDSLKEKDHIKKNIDLCKTRIMTHISPLMKLLRKYERLSVNKERINFTIRFMESPVKVLSRDLEKFLILLIDIRKFVERDQVKLDTKMKGKVLSRMNEILMEKTLTRMMEEFENNVTKLDVFEKTNYAVVNELSVLKRNLGRLNIKTRESRFKELSELNKKILKDMEERKKNIEMECCKIGEDIILKLN